MAAGDVCDALQSLPQGARALVSGALPGAAHRERSGVGAGGGLRPSESRAGTSGDREEAAGVRVEQLEEVCAGGSAGLSGGEAFSAAGGLGGFRARLERLREGSGRSGGR